VTELLSFRQIRPDEFQSDAFRLSMLNGLRKVGTKVKQDFDKTVATWNHKVRFRVRPTLAENQAGFLVETDDERYALINNGLVGPPHGVEPNLANVAAREGENVRPVLKFPETYHKKTLPGVINSFRGGPVGFQYARRAPKWKGIEARKFDEAIFEKWEPLVGDELQQTIDDAAIASGYSI